MPDLKQMKALFENAGPEARRELTLLMWAENRIDTWRTDANEIISILRRHYEGDRKANLCRIAALPQRSDQAPFDRKVLGITPLTFEDGEQYRRFRQSRVPR